MSLASHASAPPYVCTQKVSGSERQKRAYPDEFSPLATHPSSSRFGGQNRAIQIPLRAGKFQTLGDDLLAAASNNAAANQEAGSLELVIAHALQIVALEVKDCFAHFDFLAGATGCAASGATRRPQ